MKSIDRLHSSFEVLRQQIIKCSLTKEQFRKYKKRFNLLVWRFNSHLFKDKIVIIDDFSILEE